MAKKEITRIAKLELPGGEAKPGAALAGIGLNMGQFIKQFNDNTANRKGDIVPVVITVYNDKSFEFETKITPTVILIKKELGITKGAQNQKKQIGKITKEQLEKIAKIKIKDMNTTNIDSAIKLVAGTAKQMGLEIEGLK